MTDIIIIAVLIAIIAVAVGCVIKAKKSGKKCIGCPGGGCCSSKAENSSDCGCGCSGCEK